MNKEPMYRIIKLDGETGIASVYLDALGCIQGSQKCSYLNAWLQKDFYYLEPVPDDGEEDLSLMVDDDLEKRVVDLERHVAKLKANETVPASQRNELDEPATIEWLMQYLGQKIMETELDAAYINVKVYRDVQSLVVEKVEKPGDFKYQNGYFATSFLTKSLSKLEVAKDINKFFDELKELEAR